MTRSMIVAMTLLASAGAVSAHDAGEYERQQMQDKYKKLGGIMPNNQVPPMQPGDSATSGSGTTTYKGEVRPSAEKKADVPKGPGQSDEKAATGASKTPQ